MYICYQSEADWSVSYNDSMAAKIFPIFVLLYFYSVLLPEFEICYAVQFCLNGTHYRCI